MNARTLLFVWLTIVVPLTARSQNRLSDVPIGKVHACDLIDEATASTLFLVPITHRYPNRQIESVEGAIQSVCMFRATVHNSLKTALFEYPSEAEASLAYSKYAADTEYLTNKPQAGLADVASWWHIGIESYGFTVRKGKRVYILEGRWGEEKSEARRKEQLKPIAAFAVRKL